MLAWQVSHSKCYITEGQGHSECIGCRLHQHTADKHMHVCMCVKVSLSCAILLLLPATTRGFLCCVASTRRLHRLHTVQAVCDGVMLSGTLASSISAHHRLGTCHVCLLGVMAEIGCWPTCLM